MRNDDDLTLLEKLGCYLIYLVDYLLDPFIILIVVALVFTFTPWDKVGTALQKKLDENNTIVETKTIPITFSEVIVVDTNRNSKYIVYRILDDGGKELYSIDSEKALIYDTLDSAEQEYLEEDYNKRGKCCAIRIYTHKWNS